MGRGGGLLRRIKKDTLEVQLNDKVIESSKLVKTRVIGLLCAVLEVML